MDVKENKKYGLELLKKAAEAGNEDAKKMIENLI